MSKVKVIGAGLAGSEAAWQLAQRGVQVELIEMKPHKMTPAHHSEYFGELAYDTIIQRNVRLGEAPSHGKPVMLYDAAAVGATAYLMLAKEFLKRNRNKK